jgi:hypothetical protein
MRIGGVISLATVTMPGDLGVNPRSAPQRVRQLLQHQESRAFAQQKPVARLVKWTHCPRGTAVVFCHRPQPAKSGLHQFKNCLRTAGDRDIDVVEADHPRRVPDGVAA